MAAPILYYWAPCATCSVVVNYANEKGIELDKRDVEQVAPYEELLACYPEKWAQLVKSIIQPGRKLL